ncbi:MAG: hypothetical protein JWQ79_3717 [Mucilaginibacter sp.]|jgi:outer membrane protein TolC|nr:hypothetical protein [Mucilaginibacter sp.]
MKKLSSIVFLLFTLFSFKASAQETILPSVDYNYLEKLIQAAKENFPRKKIFDKQAESAKTAIPITTLSYLDMFTASYFYRPDQNVVIATPGTTGNPYSVNGWQFGFNVSLGQFIEKPFMIKKAKKDYEIAELQAQEYGTTLTMEVKRRYYDYVEQQAALRIAIQAAQDNIAVAEISKNRFAKGELTLDVYNQSRINLSAANTARITAETSYLKAKDLLEEIIGKKLSEIK